MLSERKEGGCWQLGRVILSCVVRFRTCGGLQIGSGVGHIVDYRKVLN